MGCIIKSKILTRHWLEGDGHTWSHFYLTGRPPHWTAARGHWSEIGIWWRWLCGLRGTQWRNGRFGSRGQQWAWRSLGQPPSLVLTGSNSWSAWTSSPLGWTCYYSEPVEVEVGYVTKSRHDQSTKCCILQIVSYPVNLYKGMCVFSLPMTMMTNWVQGCSKQPELKGEMMQEQV